MSDFKKAIEELLGQEGGYVDNPKDAGGATNWGISARFLKAIGDPRHPKDLTRENAIALYHVHFWDALGLGEIEDARIASRLLDIAVNAGPGWAGRLVQRALRACMVSGIKEDGVLGPATRAAIASANPMLLMVALRSEQAGRYREILARDASQEVFIRGWINRAYSA